MNEQMLKILETIAERFNTTSEKLWEVLLRQAVVVGMVYAMCLIVCFTILVLSYRIIVIKTKKDGDWSSREVDVFFPWILWIMTALLFVITTGHLMAEIITGFVNPEYWAIKTILGR